MKFGVLMVTPIGVNNERKFINLGDTIQTKAILNLYDSLGIKKENIVKIELKNIMKYSGEYIILPININLSFNWIINIFPLPDHIIPIFLGLSYFSAEKFPFELANYFRTYAPIGCRDEFTLKLMRDNNISAYLYGCITATLPKRSDNICGNKIFFVDTPESVESFLPPQIANDSGLEYISHIRSEGNIEDIGYIEDITNQLLQKYAREAKLIITSRLHCMSPAMALGVPIIAITDNCSPRMGWIDKFIHIYNPEDFDKIDWNPKIIEYEDIKKQMIEVAGNAIISAYKKFSGVCDLSYFYENRVKSNYGNYYEKRLREIKGKITKNFKYIIWGTGQIGINAYSVISKIFPESEMVAVVDSFCNGTFFGKKIQRPYIIKDFSGAYIFIATYSGEKSVKDMLKSYGKVELKDYLSLASTSG